MVDNEKVITLVDEKYLLSDISRNIWNGFGIGNLK
jgi:hypothetical protein